MISLDEAVGWLNQFDTSHLGLELQLPVQQLQDSEVPANRFNTLRLNLRRMAEGLMDPLALPETLIQIGYAEAKRGHYPEARDSFREAYHWYRSNSQEHRTAVSAWLLGLVEMITRDDEEAHGCWVEARQIFQRRAAFFVQRRMGDRVNWYQERQKKMLSEMTKTADEAYDWMNRADPVYADKMTVQLAQRMLEEARGGRYASAGKLIEALQAIGQKSHQTAELPQMLAACGLVAYHMSMPQYAVELLRESIGRFRPDSHKQASVRWMLGVIYWMLKESTLAEINWRESLVTFRNLSLKADQKNDQPLRAWYDERILAMEKAIEEVVGANFP